MKSMLPALFALVVPACAGMDDSSPTTGLDPTGDWSVLETFPAPRCNIAGGSTDVFSIYYDDKDKLVVDTTFEDVTTTADLVDANMQLARVMITATNHDWLGDGGSETADWSFDLVVDEHGVIAGSCEGTIHMATQDCVQTCAVTGTLK